MRPRLLLTRLLAGTLGIFRQIVSRFLNRVFLRIEGYNKVYESNLPF